MYFIRLRYNADWLMEEDVAGVSLFDSLGNDDGGDNDELTGMTMRRLTNEMACIIIVSSFLIWLCKIVWREFFM